MSDESKQHWLDRNRPPRVQITYDVETLGSSVKVELPLVVGILADLLGDTDPGNKLKERKFVQVDRDNFDDFLGQLRPTLKLGGMAGQSGLTFTKLDDFLPLEIVKHSANLKALLDERQRLVDLVAKLSGNDTLNDTFQQVFGDQASGIPQVKSAQVQRQRQPFQDAVQAARTLTDHARDMSRVLEAMDRVIQAARKVHRVPGAYDLLMALLPGETNAAALKTAVDGFAPGDDAKTKALLEQLAKYREKLAGILAPDAGKALSGMLDTLVQQVDAAKDDKDDKVLASLDAIKKGPTKDLTLQPVTDIDTRTKAYLAAKDKAQGKSDFDAAVKALRELAGNFEKLDGALQELKAAAGVSKKEQDDLTTELTDAKTALGATKLDKAKTDDIAAKAEDYAKKPSDPKPLQTAILAAFTPALPGDLDLSQATVLRQSQERITAAAEARVRRALLMEPKEQEKATAAYREALQFRETARKIEGLAQAITGALGVEPSPEQLKQFEKLSALAEELHNAAEAATKEAQQQLQDAFPSSAN